MKENNEYQKYESKLIFMSPEKEKEWDSLDKIMKQSIMSNLRMYTDEMENKLSIELLCNVINEMSRRLDELEREMKGRNNEGK